MVGSSSLRRSSSYDFLPPDLFEGDPNMEAKQLKTVWQQLKTVWQQLKTMVQMMENVKRLKTAMFPGNNDNYKEEIKTALQSQKKFNKVRLNVAVTGEAGSGESTLVNGQTILIYGRKGAAPTGVWETTMKPKEYIHPQNRNITVWDLPGVGSTEFPADKYKERVEFKKYDFFIIVSNHRFKENDAKLAKDIDHIDQDIKNEKANDPDFNEENLLKSIRDYCTEELQKLGFESPKVFLVSGLRLHLYEFKDLWKTLKEDLPKLQRDVLLLALPNISLDVLQQKKGSLASKIKWFSAVSAAGLIPGLSGAFDPGIIMGFTHHCRISLGLTPEELKRLSDVSGVSLEDLRAELKSPLSEVEMTTALIGEVLSSSAAYVAATAMVAMAISSATTYSYLTYILNSLDEDAQWVFMNP